MKVVVAGIEYVFETGSEPSTAVVVNMNTTMAKALAASRESRRANRAFRRVSERTERVERGSPECEPDSDERDVGDEVNVIAEEIVREA
ncbi:hypothetical protein PC114_g16823 [Phytophthora cactorum]|nr:hypothetical protein PC114_g16823 [Phytophthora cactorum]